ncbi:MAG: hypothetical protein QOF48_617 [Verrucomicrobiota bacterium]|jgi:hypothetical protein
MEVSPISGQPERAKGFWIRRHLENNMIRERNKWLWTLLLPLVAMLAPASQAACTYVLSTTSRTHGYGTASNTVVLTTSNTCSWTVVNSNNWITLISAANGSGSFTNIYLVAANPNPTWRTGNVVIANQLFTIRQNPVPCSYALSPQTRTHGYSLATGTVSVATSGGCAWFATNTTPWINLVSGSNGSGGGTMTYTVNENTSANWRTGVVFVADQSYTVIQRGSPCLYDISPTSRVITAGSVSGLITISATAGCVWAVSNANNWISITSGANGVGNGSVTYSASANPSGMARTGLVTIADQTFSLSQLGLPCSYSISPATQSQGLAAGTGVITVSATLGCNWAAATTNNWITFASAANGTGAGSVTYSVPVNPGSGVRTGMVTIGGQHFTVTQPGLGCSFKLSVTNRVHGYGAATNTVSVTTSNTCPWEIVNPNNWVTFPSGSSGAGSNMLVYTLEANPGPEDRTAIVTIGGQALTLTQHGVICNLSLSPDSRTHGFGAASNAVSVSTSPGCAWTTVNSNGWITVVSGTSGMGDGMVGYLVAANPDAQERVATLLIGDQFLVITQRAAVCNYSIATTNITHGFTAETGLVAVTAVGGCAWTASNSIPWISLTSITDGMGSGVVTYRLATNLSDNPRSGVIYVAGEAVTVYQLGMACSYRLSPTSRTHGSGANANNIGVIASNGCAWSVVNTNPWLTINSGMSGTGSASVGYSVDANTATGDRSGAVVIGGQPFLITQRGVGCNISVSPAARNHGYGVASNSFTITTGTNCAWTVGTTNDWMTIVLNPAGTGNGTVGYTVEANPSSLPRTGAVFVADQTLVISQYGSPCAFSIVPSTGSHSAGTETGVVAVTVVNACAWTVSNSNSWITIQSGANGLGSGSVSYWLAANPTVNSRTGIVMIADDPYTIIQSGLPVVCTYRLSPTNRVHGYGATANSISLIADSGCVWSVLNTNDWIAITSPLSGTSSATINYSVEPNPNFDERTGYILIGGQPFLLTQRGLSCSYSLSPVTRTHGFAATTGSVAVTASSGCGWTVSNTNQWITIVAGASGNGNGSFTYTIPGNFSPIQRTGVVVVADQTLTMVQRAATNGFVFETIVMQSLGQSKLRLAGAPAGVWRLQGSSNLVNWVNISTITNITGVVEYTDAGLTNGKMRFYRAVQP